MIVRPATLALLRGGPDYLPQIWEVPSDGPPERVKIPHGNRYEHFEFSQEYADIGCGPMPVYRWSYSTAVAE
ncbi:DUF5988 family protein [Kitasatospora azatica]|uniref:DUF5988 family protein n=1 Tax=Kitasatospora azatica TaxID=58347 RepID=UPI001E2CBD21|nr:DUF5988 family protein [Kitasatospora azatica]